MRGPPLPWTISAGSSQAGTVIFSPQGNPGRYPGTIAFYLQNRTRSFTIIRSCSTIVGVQADFDQNAPKEPYVPKNQKSRRRAYGAIPGIRCPDAARIPWVKRLGPYTLPKKVKDVLFPERELRDIGSQIT